LGIVSDASRIVSIDTIESKDEEAFEVLTTSQKLTHRIAHDLKKSSADGLPTIGVTTERSLPLRKSSGESRKQSRPGKLERAADRAGAPNSARFARLTPSSGSTTRCR
jgi:hypothetical protein